MGSQAESMTTIGLEPDCFISDLGCGGVRLRKQLSELFPTRVFEGRHGYRTGLLAGLMAWLQALQRKVERLAREGVILSEALWPQGHAIRRVMGRSRGHAVMAARRCSASICIIREKEARLADLVRSQLSRLLIPCCLVSAAHTRANGG